MSMSDKHCSHFEPVTMIFYYLVDKLTYMYV